MSRDKRELIQTFTLAVRAYHNAIEELSDAAAECLGINLTDDRCLDILSLNGPMTAGELAETSGLTSGAITTVVDRLERAGYARRVRGTADRRHVLVEVTPLAQERSAPIYAPLLAESRAMLESYSEDELALLHDFLRRGADLSANHAARIRAMTRSQEEHGSDTDGAPSSQ